MPDAVESDVNRVVPTKRALWIPLAGLSALLLVPLPCPAAEPQPRSFEALDVEYTSSIRAVVQKYCLKCHSGDDPDGEFDLERFAKLDDVRHDTKAWLKVVEMLDNGEMPPKDAKRLPSDERKLLLGWIDQYLRAEALASAGDPGPVVLRRLGNAQYTYSLRDLTGVELSPAREFPVDGAAGEGFTNTGNALVMSPALLTKYLDAAKGVASHAVLLDDGIHFSPGTTRRDWTDERLSAIRSLYARYSDPEGRLPVEKYLTAALEERESLQKGNKTTESVARDRGLNARYFSGLWSLLNGGERSFVLDNLRARWKPAKRGDAKAIAADVARWQASLTAFQNVGHMKSWMVPLTPVATRQDVRYKFPETTDAREFTIYLATGNAGDGDTSDVVVWQQPRLVFPGRADLALRDIRDVTRAMVARRDRVFMTAARCLAAADEASRAGDKFDIVELARRHEVDPDLLAPWLDYLGIGPNAAIHLDLFEAKLHNSASYDFVNGWGSTETPSLLANSSDRHVRIPGNMKPHGVVVHPSPTLAAAVGWKSPLTTTVKVEGMATHAHPECGNGVTWALELRRGATRQRLASGIAIGGNGVKVGPVEALSIQPGDLLSLLIGPRDGSHACDLTDLALTIRGAGKDGPVWDLAGDVSSDILAGNPHADRQGNARVWHFYTEPISGSPGSVIPTGSILARWLATREPGEKITLAEEAQKLLTGHPPEKKDDPDTLLYRQLASLRGPLFSGRSLNKPSSPDAAPASKESFWGLDPVLFGKNPDGSAIDPNFLAVKAPSVVAVRLPADLVAGCEFVAGAVVNTSPSGEGVAQVRVLDAPPGALNELLPGTPILVDDRPSTRQRVEKGFDDFRLWFPAALCYTKIVPVDEVVTLTLFHREDEPLRRLMLDADETARLDRLWSELHFVSQDALTLVDAFAQLMEYATQDSDPRLFEPFRKPIHERAASYRKALLDAEPRQLDAVLWFASRAYRRPLTEAESTGLRTLYKKLRSEELPHDEAIRLTLARVLVAPAFLYRVETAAPGASATPVSGWEMASRLSYFLWSSVPDQSLRDVAASGRLYISATVASEARRMLADAKVRRLATEFACQWLHVYNFDEHDEKSDRHFPSFAGLRGAMYEETIRFFTDLFQNDGSILTIFDSDHTFLNEPLAKHYGIPGVTGSEWRRVEGVRSRGRGGILGFSTTLAAQSGASRTSPILRGNWISETLLGEKLPKPPKDVPRLPEDEADTGGLTVRQLVEKHTSDPRCMSCHAKIDPLGYALESFDPIGRRREKDLADRPIDSHARLVDGAEFDGIDGLRAYLLTKRRDAVVRQFNRKLLGYALGRGVQLSDEPLLDEIRERLESNGYRFSVAVEAIVQSRQFRAIRGKDRIVVDAQ